MTVPTEGQWFVLDPLIVGPNMIAGCRVPSGCHLVWTIGRCCAPASSSFLAVRLPFGPPMCVARRVFPFGVCLVGEWGSLRQPSRGWDYR
ncbi:unnamed protein product [Prunus armeniaca]